MSALLSGKSLSMGQMSRPSAARIGALSVRTPLAFLGSSRTTAPFRNPVVQRIPRATAEADSSIIAETPEFNLPMAVAMAGYTFHSYLEPYGADGFHDMGPDGTETIFTDKEFVREQFKAIMYLEVISGRSLSAADLNGLSDPYAVITVGGSSAKTKVIDKTLNPTWSERFFFYVSDPVNEVVKIDVYDQDLLTSDDELGYIIMPLAEVSDGTSHDLDLKLLGPTAGQGRIQIRALMIAMDDIPEEVLETMVATKTGNPSEGGPRNRSAPNLVTRLVDHYMATKLPNLVEEAMEKRKAMLDELSNIVNNPKEVPPLEQSDWAGLAEMAGKDRWAHGVPVCFVENHNSDTQVWIYRRNDTRECVVAFRGTEQAKFQDVLTDLNVAMCNLEDGSLEDNKYLPLTLRVAKALTARTDQINVHHGFYIATLSMEAQLQYWVDKICGFGEKGRWKIYSTGHSLGGALATMFAFRMMTRQGRGKGVHDVIHYTYGAPRVGNKAFVETFDRLVKDSWRITNKDDVIPLTPRLLGYGHVRSNAMITAQGELVLQANRGGKDVFGDGGSLVEVAKDFFKTVASQDPEMLKKWEGIVEDEKNLFETMKDGSAFVYHLEPAYCESLQRVAVDNAEQMAKEVASLAAIIETRAEDDRIALAEYV